MPGLNHHPDNYHFLMWEMHPQFIRAFIHWNLAAEIEFLSSDIEGEDLTSFYLAGGPL